MPLTDFISYDRINCILPVSLQFHLLCFQYFFQFSTYNSIIFGGNCIAAIGGEILRKKEVSAPNSLYSREDNGRVNGHLLGDTNNCDSVGPNHGNYQRFQYYSVLWAWTKVSLGETFLASTNSVYVNLRHNSWSSGNEPQYYP